MLRYTILYCIRMIVMIIADNNACNDRMVMMIMISI